MLFRVLFCTVDVLWKQDKADGPKNSHYLRYHSFLGIFSGWETAPFPQLKTNCVANLALQIQAQKHPTAENPKLLHQFGYQTDVTTPENPVSADQQLGKMGTNFLGLIWSGSDKIR